MRYVIDGYNLLHAMGVLCGRVGPRGLEKARLRLLGLLHGAYGDTPPDVTVVFDAAGAPSGVEEEQEYRGIHIKYALHEQADDVIEDLIQHEAAPRQLAVVSDDHRLQQAARRRQCEVRGCLDYVEGLARERRAHRPHSEGAGEQKEMPSAKEAQQWLREFGDIKDQPEWKELFDTFDLEE